MSIRKVILYIILQNLAEDIFIFSSNLVKGQANLGPPNSPQNQSFTVTKGQSRLRRGEIECPKPRRMGGKISNIRHQGS